MSASTEMIKELLTIESALELYLGMDLSNIKIKRRSFNISCPFHHDKHPSFTIWSKERVWKCWAGCGSGDVINLIAAFLNIPNNQAIKLLANDLGIVNERNEFTIPSQYLYKAKKHRIERDMLEAFKRRYNKAFFRLLAIEKAMKEQTLNIKSIEKAEEKSLLYHHLPYLAHLLDILVEGNFDDQVDTVLIIESILNGG
ncbi:CHC2 zinc finger domain-containing protein [Priestia megaterium]|uniref:CHC2 zinc finger domain-containing protein n=1 Tax=Priestia megaterium TaxID=1404 RepID=UPI00300B30D6